MNRGRFQRNLPFGIVLHGNKIWLSEFLGMVLTGVLVCALLVFMSLIIYNMLHTARLDKEIRGLRTGRITMTHEIEQLRGQQRIASALKDFAGSRVPDSTIYHLVALVYTNSQQFGYDPLLMLAVIHVEGRFSPTARGRYRSGAYSGALGLMQLKFATASEVGADLGIALGSEQDLFRPEVNIPIGIAYITRLITKFRSFKLGLMAYNQGPAAVYQALSGEIPFSIEYFNKVLRSYYRFVKITDALEGEGYPAPQR